MGTQGTGRKRSTKKDRTTAEDDALNLIAREAEARLAAKRAARAEAREIRMKELERQQKELSDDDERMSVGSRGSVRVEDRDYLEKGSRAASALTSATLTSLGGTSSRRGSGETALTVDAESSIREIKEIHELKDQIQDVEAKYTQNLKEAKDALAEVEEKYRKAMVSNAQLDNEKNNLMYQVDTLKDSLMELEELLSESRREYDEKVKECEREKYAHSVLQFQFNEMKETLKQSEELLNEIRQLRVKQEGFVREISDLQETVEWKDKKIGALERQKEYTDAIRTERDELREEVVKLKDILKKHGIVLGPDLNINGDVGVAEADECPGADPASQPAQDSQTPPAEGNSMLGNTEETELRSSREEGEVDPEQQQEMPEEVKENHTSSDLLCNAADESTLETSNEEQPPEKEETCLPTEETNSKDLNAEICDSTDSTEPKEVIVCSPELQEIVKSPDVAETEMSEEFNLKDESSPDAVETETKSIIVETSDVHDGKQEAVEESSLTNAELCPQQKHAEVVPKESLIDESIAAASITEPQQEPENAEEAENDEAEETPSKSQSQGTPASGKKKKKKKRGKKKGGAQDDKTKQKTADENRKDKRIEPAENDVGSAAEPTSGSVTATFKESKMDQVKNAQDNKETEEVDAVEPIKSSEVPLKETFEEPTMDHVSNEREEEQTLETNTVEQVVVEPTQTICETPKEVTVDDVMDEQNQEQTLETKITDSGETGEPTPRVSHVEALEESSTVSKMDDQGTKQTLETNKIEETELVSLAENPCQEETLNKVTVDDVTEEQPLETQTEQSVKTEEPTESSSHLETLKESVTDSKEYDHDEEQTLEVETFHDVEAVAPSENTETPSEITVEPVTDEQNEGETLEMETIESEEAVKSVSPVETLKESRTDAEKDKQDHEQTFEREEVKEMETIPILDAEANVCTANLHSNSAETTDGFNKECTSSVDDSESITIPTDGDVIRTDQAEDEAESDSKCESTSNNSGNSPETSNNTEGESHVPGDGDVAANEPESASESKDDTPILPPSTDHSLDGIKSSSDMEPSKAINLGRDDLPIYISNEDPKELGDEEPRAEIEQECLPAGAISPSQDVDNSDNGNLKEPKELVSPAEKHDSCDGASSTERPEAFSTEKGLSEAVVQDEELEISTAAVFETPQTPKEATEIGSLIDQESAVTENLEHKNDKHDEESESSLSAEQLQKSSEDQCDNKDSSQPTEADSEGEEYNEDEGQSFDFDDMDIEAAVEPSLLLEQEHVEEGVTVMPDESNNGPCQNNAESNENKPVERNGGSNQADKDSDAVPQEEQNSEEATSEKVENVCEEEKNTPEAGEGDQAGQVAEEETILGAVAENINQTVSSPAEERIDGDKNVLQGEDEPKSADQVGSNKGAAQSKKSGKKGKGKGKEDCKMS
ncbi:titin isoform X3 [Archocentrus centrarchus]|uniref:titin isoform X3 n=1 Tax=Archocentrus centrarchus TaxID=63155 RepID=UPI0011E9BD13|nr:titin-like isoform X3 [Archocentrus centrarchus]